MKLSFQLAYRNLMGAGLRTWLSVAVLSFAFVVIIFYNGLLDGWIEQSMNDSIAWQYGEGQLQHQDYDEYDPFTYRDAHGPVPSGEAVVPILVRQASIYPEGRLLTVTLKGIAPTQTTLKLPTTQFAASSADIPAIIGKRMARSAKLKKGDEVLMRWRDKNGTFDAATVTITDVFDTDVAGADAGQIWIPIEKLWEMTELQGQASLAVFTTPPKNTGVAGWNFKTQDELLDNIRGIAEVEQTSGYIFMVLLLAVAMLAIFDTQVLSIFRRQKEIGTFVALGMTRQQVVQLFTVEGAMYSLFAVVIGALYGTPLFVYFATQGIGMPVASTEMGVSVARRLFPTYGPMLVIGTVLLVIVVATIVSYLPARKIANLNPVNALRGKML